MTDPTPKDHSEPEKTWCAACGTWGDHGSGTCPTITHKPKDHSEAEQSVEERFVNDIIDRGLIKPQSNGEWVAYVLISGHAFRHKDAHYQPIVERLTKEVELFRNKVDELMIKHRPIMYATTSPNTITVGLEHYNEIVKENESLREGMKALQEENDRQDKLINELCVKLERSKQVIEAAEKLPQYIMDRARDHYWDSFQKDKDIILKHLEHIVELAKASRQPPNPSEPV